MPTPDAMRKIMKSLHNDYMPIDNTAFVNVKRLRRGYFHDNEFYLLVDPNFEREIAFKCSNVESKGEFLRRDSLIESKNGFQIFQDLKIEETDQNQIIERIIGSREIAQSLYEELGTNATLIIGFCSGGVVYVKISDYDQKTVPLFYPLTKEFPIGTHVLSQV